MSIPDLPTHWASNTPYRVDGGLLSLMCEQINRSRLDVGEGLNAEISENGTVLSAEPQGGGGSVGMVVEITGVVANGQYEAKQLVYDRANFEFDDGDLLWTADSENLPPLADVAQRDNLAVGTRGIARQVGGEWVVAAIQREGLIVELGGQSTADIVAEGRYSTWTPKTQGSIDSNGLFTNLNNSVEGIIDTANPLWELNGTNNLESGTLVFAYPFEVLNTDTNEYETTWVFSGQGAFKSIAYGQPLSEVNDISSTLTIKKTGQDGSNLLDDSGSTIEVDVHRASDRGDIWMDLQSTDVLRYIPYSSPDNNGVVGCLFGRTENFRFSPDASPPSSGPTLGSPSSSFLSASNATGDAANSNHVYVLGHMYADADDGSGTRPFRPWFILNPDAANDRKVAADANDTLPGNLDAKLDTPDDWLDSNVSTAGDTVEITHNDAVATGGTELTYLSALSTASNTIVAGENDFTYDAKGHISANSSNADTVITLNGDGVWTEAVAGAANEILLNHIGPDTAGSGTSFTYLTSLTVSAGGTIEATESEIEYDDKGHIRSKVTGSSDTVTLAGDGTWTEVVSDTTNNTLEINHIGPDTVATDTPETFDRSGNTITSRIFQYDEKGHYITDIAGNSVTFDDELVKVSSNDTTPDYLMSKLTTTGNWLATTEMTDGGNETYDVTHNDPQTVTDTYESIKNLSVNGSNQFVVTSTPLDADGKGHVVGQNAVDTATTLDLVAVDVVTDIRVTSTAVEKKTRRVYVMAADAESGWTNVHTGTTC